MGPCLRGSRSFRSFVRSFALPTLDPASCDPRGARPSRPVARGLPLPGFSVDRSALRGIIALPQGHAVSPVSGSSRPRFLASPSARKVGHRGRSSLTDICKTPDRRSRCRSSGRHPLSGSGKVPGASSRFCRAAARPAIRAVFLSDFKAFSRLGHACQDCRHSARRVGPQRPAFWPSAHCPPPFPKGTGDRQREHR